MFFLYPKSLLFSPFLLLSLLRPGWLVVGCTSSLELSLSPLPNDMKSLAIEPAAFSLYTLPIYYSAYNRIKCTSAQSLHFDPRVKTTRLTPNLAKRLREITKPTPAFLRQLTGFFPCKQDTNLYYYFTTCSSHCMQSFSLHSRNKKVREDGRMLLLEEVKKKMSRKQASPRSSFFLTLLSLHIFSLLQKCVSS
jgi:hypothetical protein